MSLSDVSVDRGVVLRLGGSGGSPEVFHVASGFSVGGAAALPLDGAGGDDPLDAAGSSVVMASQRLASARKLAVSLLVLPAGSERNVNGMSINDSGWDLVSLPADRWRWRRDGDFLNSDRMDRK